MSLFSVHRHRTPCLLVLSAFLFGCASTPASFPVPTRIIYHQALDAFTVEAEHSETKTLAELPDTIPVVTVGPSGIVHGLVLDAQRSAQARDPQGNWQGPLEAWFMDGEWVVWRTFTLLTPDGSHTDPLDIQCRRANRLAPPSLPRYYITCECFINRGFKL